MAIIAGTLLSASAACAEPRPSAPEPTTAGAPAPPSRATPVPPARRAGSVVRPQRPHEVVLPSGRTVAVDAVGTTDRGLLDVPSDIEVAGWWRGGSRLGDPFGSVVVAAHVDSRTQGLGPFAELLEVDPGATVTVRSPGLGQVFEVRSRRLVRQGSLTDDLWIFDPGGVPRLVLVTCAPPYDASRGGYQNLAVVTAVPTGPAVPS